MIVIKSSLYNRAFVGKIYLKREKYPVFESLWTLPVNEEAGCSGDTRSLCSYPHIKKVSGG